MLSRDELLRLVAQPAVRLHSASVYKRRFRFTLAARRAEYDQLLVNGAAVESVAIESVEPQAVLKLQATLQLDDFENQSYPLALSRMLGITPLPGEDGSGQGQRAARHQADCHKGDLPAIIALCQCRPARHLR
jgi:hypothetical protein